MDRTPEQGLELDRVVLLGRTFEEYSRSFALVLDSLRKKTILDVAAGVSSFRAEASERGLDVAAFDVIYELPAAEIQHRCKRDLDHIVSSIGNLNVYRWDFYKNPERLRTFREHAYQTFLLDYSSDNKER